MKITAGVLVAGLWCSSVAAVTPEQVAAAVAFGKGKADLPDVRSYELCAAVSLAGPQDRIATVVRAATKQLKDASEADIEAEAKDTLVAYFSQEAPYYKFNRWNCRSTGSSKPERILLMSRDEQRLEADGETKVTQSEWHNAMGAGFTTNNAAASFDLAKAMALAGGKTLYVVVTFDSGEPQKFEFKEKHMRQIADPLKK